MEIQDYTEYTSRMSRAVFDKLFFIDKVDATLFVDYGCGDGALVMNMHNILSHESGEFKFSGYDDNQSMLDKANAATVDIDNINFTNSWDHIKQQLKNNPDKKSALILSSIIHEVYHYMDVKQVDKFWKDVFSAGFNYIIIRDMIPSSSIDRQSDINDVMKVRRVFHNTKPLMDFEKIWGSISNNKNLTHFLLKYKYVEPNWEREVKENYLPLYQEDLISFISPEYNILYHNHFLLPYIKEQVVKDFDIDIKDNTHLKLILKR